MLKALLTSFCCFLFTTILFANYPTPGTGVKWNLADLVTNSGGIVTTTTGIFYVNDTVFISKNDTLQILDNEVVRFAQNSLLDVNGVLIVNPPDSVVFTKIDGATSFGGVRLDSTDGTLLRKLVFEYAFSMRIADCAPLIDSSIFRFNSNTSTTGIAAINVTRSGVVITNTQFVNNYRAAIQSGANVNNAPQVSRCYFAGNNTMNQNVPQINLGPSGTDTTRIMFNRFERAAVRSGAIGFLPIGDLNTIIHGNVIRNNRYGINLQGGSNINSLVSYNQIDSNNIENNPLLGGSGIAFSGGTATSHQNSIVTGNLIRWNLWGITIQGGSQPNIGNLTNADTTDDGKNHFEGNNNSSDPMIDLYNNSAYDIWAQGNYWNTNNVSEIEDRIFHDFDNAALGVVNYSNYIVPVQLTQFVASVVDKDVRLSWTTITEVNSNHFIIERSINGRDFDDVGRINAAGHSVQNINYYFTDFDVLGAGKTLFYRLKQVDKDGRHTFSPIVTVRPGAGSEKMIVYPTIVLKGSRVNIEIQSSTTKAVLLTLIAADGKIISSTKKLLSPTISRFDFVVPVACSGAMYLSVSGEGLSEVTRLFVH